MMAPQPPEPQPGPPEPPAPTPVTTDLPCHACGYNLRGLDGSAACPECGTPVVNTLQTSLRSSDPQWLRTLHSGAGWVCAAIFVLTHTLLGLLGEVDRYGPWGRNTAATVVLTVGGGLVALVCWLKGIWRLSREEPGHREPQGHRAPRKRLMLSALLGGGALVGYGWCLNNPSFDDHSRIALAVPVGLALVLGPLGVARRVRCLLERLPDPRLMRQSRWILVLHVSLVGVIAAFLVGALPLLIALKAQWISVPTVNAGLGILTGASVVAQPVAVLWMFFLLLAVRRRLRATVLGPSAASGPASATRGVRALAARLLAPARARWLTPAVAVVVLVLNLWPVQKPLTVRVAAPTPTRVAGTVYRWGWPVTLHSAYAPPGRPGRTSAVGIVADLLAAGLLVAMTAAAVRDVVHCQEEAMSRER